VPPFQWPLDASAASGLHNNAGDYVSWATWAVDALYYLDDLDQQAERLRWIRAGHLPDTVDLAHARWAVGTAMTALDLSAAAVGVHHGAPLRQGNPVHDVTDLNAVRGQLCSGCVTWLDGVVQDRTYPILKDARDKLVHRKLPRFIYANVGGPPPGTDRLGLAVLGAGGSTREMSCGELVALSRDTATRHVIALLQVAQAGQV
jgi:hypothetical protein